MKGLLAIGGLILGFAGVMLLPSYVHAQTSPLCVPSGSSCSGASSAHWEFDNVRNVCYQPFSQCGGTEFKTQVDCEVACITILPTSTEITPADTATPTPPLETETPTSSPTATIAPSSEPTATVNPTSTCVRDNPDVNKDGVINLIDFEFFRKEFLGEELSKRADMNCDGRVSLSDFEIFRSFFTAH
ncbi:hypothetical protein A3B02_02095 [Candidatus Roizmanbacteria bacterium RIFCSPLOWO2_01_FULL_42_14]|uniref:Dockerin domain-containing protein n=3 Tax=Candidatus Roizmaniibacteriota TaxID=1752723 RepID=A0A1F7JW84_9BACT|nr:MAG: hypothetical protein A3D08_00155 [Candidatus Roizmanbacteria bacterium RIFCSPHIGHO2_02_FULL_43_11]OGK52555.1 MAG: hypothetical protein A3B02_02095 [Candidatus Roizmanbacteria bacterium RIFCSPLOWO2_01_FULL_42_14]OGK59869.1 MAG: hypothetical protein A3I56_03305 [Candidatus Roizmanbacteria bacterium RIFCSPLOWO2_02_FULL_43_10]